MAEPGGEPADRLTLNVVLVGLGISGLTSFGYEIYRTRASRS